MPAPLITLGHGTASRHQLTALITGAARITHLVDVRRFPGSRTRTVAAMGGDPSRPGLAGERRAR